MKKIFLLSVLILSINGVFAQGSTDSSSYVLELSKNFSGLATDSTGDVLNLSTRENSSSVANLGYSGIRQFALFGIDVSGWIPIVGNVIKIIPQSILGITEKSAGVVSRTSGI